MKMDSKSKTLKYWYSSTGRGMRNNRTIHQASGLKRKLWLNVEIKEIKMLGLTYYQCCFPLLCSYCLFVGGSVHLNSVVKMM